MKKHDYELIASCLNSGISYIEKVAYNTITHRFATELASKNPRFNKDMFLKACGVELKQKCCNGNTRYLDCDDCKNKGITCNELICCDCGATVE